MLRRAGSHGGRGLRDILAPSSVRTTRVAIYVDHRATPCPVEVINGPA